MTYLFEYTCGIRMQYPQMPDDYLSVVKRKFGLDMDKSVDVSVVSDSRGPIQVCVYGDGKGRRDQLPAGKKRATNLMCSALTYKRVRGATICTTTVRSQSIHQIMAIRMKRLGLDSYIRLNTLAHSRDGSWIGSIGMESLQRSRLRQTLGSDFNFPSPIHRSVSSNNSSD